MFIVGKVSVSVVVPVYNVKPYLPRCLDSLLMQTFQDYELILVDDGSQDGSGDVCDKYAREFERVRVYHKENGGLSSARNYGVGKAQASRVTFVDSDDYVSETYLADLLHLGEAFDADMAIISVQRCSEKQTETVHSTRLEDHCLDATEAFREVYTGGIVNWSGCGKLIRKCVLKEFPFPDGYYEDSASAYLHIFACNKVAIGDYSNDYKYIRRQDSITASRLRQEHYRIFSVCGEIRSYVLTHYPQMEYVTILVYQNAVLQLLTRIQMPWNCYRSIFLKYRGMFRRNCLAIIKRHDVRLASKYYILMLSTVPCLFKLQNMCLKIVREH